MATVPKKLARFTIVHLKRSSFFVIVADKDVDLVDVFEDVWRVHEDADGADGGDDEEDVELKPIDNHRHKFPVFANLKNKKSNISQLFLRQTLSISPYFQHL